MRRAWRRRQENVSRKDLKNKMFSVAIDGPSGAGKSTVAKGVAKKIGFLYVDTGAIYRTVGLYAKNNGIDPQDEKLLSEHFEKIKPELRWIDGTQHVFLSGEDVSEEIRTPEISMYASKVSALPAVRTFLLEMQREFARKNNVIMDGRDIGTVVLPGADVKIFMFANAESRAKRRTAELLEKGERVTYDEVLADMLVRDKNDAERQTAPCRPADDAVMLDNSELDVEQTVKRVEEIINEKINGAV